LILPDVLKAPRHNQSPPDDCPKVAQPLRPVLGARITFRGLAKKRGAGEAISTHDCDMLTHVLACATVYSESGCLQPLRCTSMALTALGAADRASVIAVTGGPWSIQLHVLPA